MKKLLIMLLTISLTINSSFCLNVIKAEDELIFNEGVNEIDDDNLNDSQEIVDTATSDEQEEINEEHEDVVEEINNEDNIEESIDNDSQVQEEQADNVNILPKKLGINQANNLTVLDTGSCGDNATYTVYSDYSMVISGTGDMYDYDFDTHITPQYTNIKTIVIEEGITSIGRLAFFNFRQLTDVDISNTIETITNDAFYDCRSLISVFIPSSVTSIDVAFRGCDNLSTIIVDPSNEVYDSRNNCNAIIETSSNTLIQGCKGTTIPNGITIIGFDAFKEHFITSIVIPSSVTTIGRFAFAFNDISSLIIPNSVSKIESDAFYKCHSLTSIFIPSTVSTINCFNNKESSPFYQCDNLKIYTDASSAQPGWDENWNYCGEYDGNDTYVPVIYNTTYEDFLSGKGFWDNIDKNATHIEIPDYITEIPADAFRNC